MPAHPHAGVSGSTRKDMDGRDGVPARVRAGPAMTDRRRTLDALPRQRAFDAIPADVKDLFGLEA